MKNNFDYFKKFRSKLILLELNNGQKHLGILKNIVKNALSIDYPGADKIFRFDDIKNLSYKKIIFIDTSTIFSEKIFNDFTTKIVESIKNEGSYSLMTRSAIFNKQNGKIKKKKQNNKSFELFVYLWINKRDFVVEICPLALINEKYLLCVYQGIFCLIEKNYNVVLNYDMPFVDFVFSKNNELLKFKEKQLQTTFKGIVKLL